MKLQAWADTRRNEPMVTHVGARMVMPKHCPRGKSVRCLALLMASFAAKTNAQGRVTHCSRTQLVPKNGVRLRLMLAPPRKLPVKLSRPRPPGTSRCGLFIMEIGLEPPNDSGRAPPKCIVSIMLPVVISTSSSSGKLVVRWRPELSSCSSTKRNLS